MYLQDAKEDAEMDAEIALEMDRERERRLSTNSNNSSVGGTYVGPCSNSPEEVGRQNCAYWQLQQYQHFGAFFFHCASYINSW